MFSEECRLLGGDAVWLLQEPTFRCNVSPPTSGSKIILRSVLQLLVSANVVPSSLIISTPMMEAIRSPITLALTKATRRHIPGGILRSHRRGNLKSLETFCLHTFGHCFSEHDEIMLVDRHNILMVSVLYWMLSDDCVALGINSSLGN
jgi:hypothetical protein